MKIEIMSLIKEQEMYQKEIATDLFFLLFQAYDNVESSVRKASVFCMVSTLYSFLDQILLFKNALLIKKKDNQLFVYIFYHFNFRLVYIKWWVTNCNPIWQASMEVN